MNIKSKILKNITTFGGVQFINLVIGVIRSKIAAMWLGAQGVGFLGIFLSAFGLVISLLNMGLPTSVIKHFSGIKSEENSKKYQSLIIITWVIAFLSALFCFVFAEYLSQYTFKTKDFTWAFKLLSISVFFKQFSNVYSSILQSNEKLQKLANANIIASFLGILFTIPLYYYFHLKGIVYNLVVLCIIEFVVFYFYVKKLNIKRTKVKQTEFVKESKLLIGDGFFFNLSGFLVLLSAYVLQLFISNYSDLKTLGNYVSGYTILNTYVAIIFTAMSFDYFPRISKIDDQDILNKEVNNQLHIGIIILFPILLILMFFSHIIIKILYSSEFVGAEIYLQVAVIGVFFKLFSWTTGFVIIAKGSRKMILSNAIIYNSVFLILHVSGFYLAGIRGVAIASNVYFLIHLFGNLFITYKKLGLRIVRQNSLTFVSCSVVIITCTLIIQTVDNFYINRSITLIFLLFAIFWSFSELKTIYKK